MSYQITAIYADGRTDRRVETGALSELQDAAYDDGAMGVTAMVIA